MSQGFHCGERSIARLELLARAARAASGLKSLDIGPGDAVAVLMRNDFAFVEASLASRMLGAYPVPINWHYQSAEVEYILTDCGAKALVVHADLLHGVRDVIPDDLPVYVAATPPEVQAAYGLNPTDCKAPDGMVEWPAWLEGFPPWRGETQAALSMIYTSGTTGRPKGVRRQPATPEQGQNTREVLGHVFGFQPGMRSIIPAPMYHSAPNAYALFGAEVESTMVLQPRFDAEEFLRLVEKHRITHVQMVPTMFVRLLKLPEEVRRQYDVSSLTNIVHAAAPCPVEVKKSMIEWWGPVINEYYGSTENGAVTFVTSQEWIQRPGTVGTAIRNTEVRILADNGQPLPAGEIGEIYMRNHNLPDFTYHGKAEQRREVETAGLITNGDIGFMDEAGYLFLCDRKVDMVISGGVNIYPAEIEAVLIAHPGIADCAVFGIPHDEYGESLAAVIQPGNSAHLSESEVRGYLHEHLAGFKVPRMIAFQADLPREDSGKIFKRKLREVYWENTGRKI